MYLYIVDICLFVFVFEVAAGEISISPEAKGMMATRKTAIWLIALRGRLCKRLSGVTSFLSCRFFFVFFFLTTEDRFAFFLFVK